VHQFAAPDGRHLPDLTLGHTDPPRLAASVAEPLRQPFEGEYDGCKETTHEEDGRGDTECDTLCIPHREALRRDLPEDQDEEGHRPRGPGYPRISVKPQCSRGRQSCGHNVGRYVDEQHGREKALRTAFEALQSLRSRASLLDKRT